MEENLLKTHLTCPNCNLRSLQFLGLGEKLYDKEHDMTLVPFKVAECPMCNWRHENDYGNS